MLNSVQDGETVDGDESVKPLWEEGVLHMTGFESENWTDWESM
ncbi:MAG: hypothetical protein NWF13_01290 [Candidatus Bathyarchaeota archaeon]|nr:hypothetical protein [Candidatus Bathyarchaeota archaeon]